MSCFRALCVLLLCAAGASQTYAQTTGAVLVTDAEIVPDDAGATCSVGASYRFEYESAGAFNVFEPEADGTSTLVGAFVLSDSELLAAGLQGAINEATASVDWSLATGTLVLIGQAPLSCGVILSDVTVTNPDATTEAFTIGSVLALETAEAGIASVRSATGVVLTGDSAGAGSGDEPGDPPVAAALGSSCSCPECSTGGRFWIPFTVIGIGNVPWGQRCCGMACDVACGALFQGKSTPDAWLIGQGTWVTCMLCGK